MPEKNGGAAWGKIACNPVEQDENRHEVHVGRGQEIEEGVTKAKV
jgi:hypothetical protein